MVLVGRMRLHSALDFLRRMTVWGMGEYMGKEIAHNDLEKMLRQGYDIQVKPHGYSMYPLIVPGRDAVIVEKANPSRLKRGDVVLYRRDHGILVLHRICKIRKDGVYLVGDNQSDVEGPLRPDQIKGRMTVVMRNGRDIPVDDFRYRLLTGLWLFLLPVRDPIKDVAHWFKEGFLGIRKWVLNLRH